MSDIAIRVENLGKAYRIARSAGRSSYKTLQEDVIGLLKRPFSRNGGGQQEVFWALRDISFEVKQGEVLGIIGRNGAGKSTLLKILSRITRPTTGHADVFGRVGSLLEVGTGFHPELTGRENIFLNGAVLGMTRRDIQRRFDEIVEFAEVEQFLDTPVKRYSSGMYMRLAFAVAAHLEPEILVVDEVLAVGDAEFQKKCLGKMGDVAKSGRTVLFVSHNMGAVSALCRSGLLLHAGLIIGYGLIADTIARYIQDTSISQLDADLSTVQRSGNQKAFVQCISLRSVNSDVRFPMTGEDIDISLKVVCKTAINDAVLCIVIYDSNGYRIIDANTDFLAQHISLQAGHTGVWRFRLRNVLLRPGVYRAATFIGKQNIESIDYVDQALTFEILMNHSMDKSLVHYPGTYRCEFDVFKDD